MKRSEVWWAALPDPAGSGPGFRRPVLIVSADSFNASRIRTVLGVVITSNLRLGAAPGNVRLPARSAGLAQASVINVSQVITLDKDYLTRRIGRLSESLMARVADGLRLVLALGEI